MSAAVMRDAATLMRAENKEGGDIIRDTLTAVATWLDAEAQSHIHVKGDDEPTMTYDLPGMDNSPAVLVARAYLGTTNHLSVRGG
jgi:dethiobiotin synthetase